MRTSDRLVAALRTSLTTLARCMQLQHRQAPWNLAMAPLSGPAAESKVDPKAHAVWRFTVRMA